MNDIEVNPGMKQQRKGPPPEYVEAIHRERELFLHAIQRSDLHYLQSMEQETKQKFNDEQLNIMKRVPNNEIRSLKNIMLSHNTLYSYVAEKGGLSAWQCHFLSEKYAIMIEHATTLVELETIHSNMVMEYADPSIRKSNGEGTSIVDKAVRYIEMYFTEDDSIEQIAAKLHVHPSHLMRTFKKAKGRTISQYRNLRRLKEAKELISFSNLTMTEISIMVGFSNPQFFSSFFKEVEGLTPVEFRKRKSSSPSSEE